MTNFKPETNLVHGGQVPDPVTGSRAVPIHRTTAFVFKDTDYAENVFALKEAGNIYSRITNPTVDVFEKRMALIEGGTAAVALSSGMAAIAFSILNIAGAGDEIIAAENLYGGTFNLFRHTLPKYGITVKFVDSTDPENFRAAITDKTKGIFAETVGNPSLNVLDIEAVAKVAHDNGLPLLVDNTFPSPYGLTPIEFGADVVIHSATKWIGGHGTTMGGVIVDAGKFDWTQGRFPGFTEPDVTYHGLRYGVDAAAAAFATKLRVQLLRDFGPCLDPDSAFNFLQGLETLHLRIPRHNENTAEVIKFLQSHPSVEWITYNGLEDHPSYELSKKYLKNGHGSIVNFGIKGGREAGRKVIDNVKIWSHVANVGDIKSLIIHPASTTHQQLDEKALEESGVTQDLIRLAVGLESPEDIIADLKQAIDAATK